MQIVPYINKVDADESEPVARELAHALLQNPNFPVARVVWGSLHLSRAASSVASSQ
jgi:hypothetical protein